MSPSATHRPVLAAVDGSPAALAGVRWAAREAIRREAPLHLVHACDTARPLRAEPGRRWLDAAVRAATEAAPGACLDWNLCFGDTADTLIERSAAASVLVLGSRGVGRFRRVLAGSVSSAVCAHAWCPVVVVAGGTAPVRPGAIVVGTDESAPSARALRFALEEAAGREAPLVAVRVWREAWAEVPVLPPRGQPDDPADQARRALEVELAGWREKYPEVDIAGRVVHAHRPADALLAAAADAALLVVGSRGRDTAAGALLGSTSQQLVRRAQCPLAVLPASH
ncbi:universal stress protein [Saccharomonospora sp. NPDC046836]|uniref:universal stress protein n=1 Tax=Saccharomonospora sp. NPDC046836 TaxID=3156921 RepID=UPI0033F58680